MKNKIQIKKKIKILKDKINKAQETGTGYSTFSELRSDKATISALEWVIE